MPASHRSQIRKFLIPLFVLTPLVVMVAVYFQKPINNNMFEFGNLRTITGVYYDAPFPMLVADVGILPDSLSRNILLVGFGKFGANATMQALEKQHGVLSGKKIMLEGTLIYGEGKTLMELTGNEESLIQIMDDPALPTPALSAVNTETLSGEILDTKCFFGVMKPGEGKPHKSCAIRCVSGGIPPALQQETDRGNQYFLVLDSEGNPINKAILPYVGERLYAKGRTGQWLGWDILYLDIENTPASVTRLSELCGGYDNFNKG